MQGLCQPLMQPFQFQIDQKVNTNVSIKDTIFNLVNELTSQLETLENEITQGLTDLKKFVI